MNHIISVAFWFTLLLLMGCHVEEKRELENYGNIVNGPGGIALTDPAEHRSGWGKKDCLLCHNVALNVHRNSGTQLDADAIIEQAKSRGESRYCLSCHTGNGVE